MNIKQKAVSGVKWQTISYAYTMILSVLKYAVLTRLLQKSDFGLVAIAMMVIGFTEIFSQLGMTIGIIHKQDITDKQYSSIYWLNVMASIFMFIVLWLCSPLLASFYKEPILNKIIPLLGIQILLNGFGKMFQTIKTKELEFKFLSIVHIVVNTVSFLVTALTAWLGWGVYSLVAGQLVMVLINQAIFAIKGMKQQKIMFHFNFSEIRDFVKIGVYQLGSSILDFVSSKIDVFLIGRFFSMSDLGVYNIAKELISKPYGVIKSLINSVASSAFAKIQNNKTAVQTYFLRMLKVLGSIAIPIYVVLFVFSDPIVRILYAPEFIEVSLFIKILAFIGIENCISGFASTLQIAYGRTDLGFKWTIVRVIMYTTVLILSSGFSITFVAYGQTVLSVVSLFLYWLMIVRPLSDIKFVSYLGSLRIPFLYSVVLAIPFILLMMFVDNLYLQVALGILYGLLFCLSYYLFQRDFLKSMVALVKNK